MPETLHALEDQLAHVEALQQVHALYVLGYEAKTRNGFHDADINGSMTTSNMDGGTGPRLAQSELARRLPTGTSGI